MTRSDPATRVQAAVWLARLRSEYRTSADEAGFQTWLEEDVEHRAAFEAATVAFETAGAIGHGLSVVDLEDEPRHLLSRRHVIAGTAATVLAASASAGLIWRRSNAGLIAGQVGRPRRFALADGSSVVLDTKSSIQLGLTDERRFVRLLSGRAQFEVASDAARPFIVESGGQQVIAVGTAFTVASDNQSMSVILEEGRVLVRPVSGTGNGEKPGEIGMEPGDRLTFAPGASKPVEDRPDLSRIGAWQTGRLSFDDDTLFTAVTELNRYNHRTIEIEDARSAGLRISGIFRADDPEGFARSAQMLLPVEVDGRGERILIRARNS